MDAVVDWSLRLLTPAEQAVLRRLSVLRGGFSLDAAIVCGQDVEGCDVADIVWSLVDKSLVVVDSAANDTRYRLLETIRAPLRRLLDEEPATVPTALAPHRLVARAGRPLAAHRPSPLAGRSKSSSTTCGQ